MVVNGRPVKRAKRRVTADLYDFFSFPSSSSSSDADDDLDGPFRSNVQVFLSRHARLLPPPSILPPPSPAGHLLTWRIGFGLGEWAVGGGDDSLSLARSPTADTVELDVVEEDVLRSKSVYCDQCRVVGWSGHPVCRKRYHFIIRNSANLLSDSHYKCPFCGSLVQRVDSSCPSCNYDITAEVLENWPHHQLEDPTHLLHGVVHANGYGHLLRVNGRDGGSARLTGSEIMDFWDRLCKMLHVRKVTVMDISKKHGMDYRMLNAVTVGQTWYGQWGYVFGTGSFGVTAAIYQEAVNALANMPLSLFFSHSASPRTQLQNRIHLYTSLSEHKLITLRDLFRYINQLLHESREHEQVISTLTKKPLPPVASGPPIGAWSGQDVRQAEDVMVKVLRAVGGSRWVSWRALKGASCGSAGPPELLDYCLRGLAGRLTDGDDLVVQSHCNVETNAIEFRLESFEGHVNELRRGVIKLSPDHLLRDLKSLYEALLEPSNMRINIPKGVRELYISSVTKVLDCKQFIKHYHDSTVKPVPSNPFHSHIWCHVKLLDEPSDMPWPPPELVVLLSNATVAELMLEATKAFRETYLVFQRFQPQQIVGFGEDSESKSIRQISDADGIVQMRGRCVAGEGKLGRFRMEKGTENWVVECTCGAEDDDGERMMACDVCGVWRHTRCAGVDDIEKAPESFICTKCRG